METNEIVKIVIATIKELDNTTELDNNNDQDFVLIHQELNSISIKIRELNSKIDELDKILIKDKEASNYKESKKPLELEEYESAERKVTLVKDLDSKAFGVKTLSRTNDKIQKALSNPTCRFTAKEIIAEVKRKHPDSSEFSGKQLLRQIRLAKGRLDGYRRRKKGIGIYAPKPTTLGDTNPQLKGLKLQMHRARNGVIEVE